ncbi:MAG: polyphenol oxidase family protein [Acidimicrobiia bacterium]|nr:polyphenol oxidase family protein [Acidimicrobiia bacterium]
MIRPPGFAGAAFGTAADGDLRRDHEARQRIAADLGIATDWAYLNQVHGASVLAAERSGNAGDGDGLVTHTSDIPVMVATADCVPVILEGTDAAAVVHAGWRGAAAGVLEAALAVLDAAGVDVQRAAIGPAIGPCCYEVGVEVAEQFPEFVAKTTWGTTSVDIPGFLAGRLEGIEVWRSEECTFTSVRMNSWRRDRTEHRQVAVAWLPNN